MSRILRADVRFLTHAEGGRLEPARDGIRPQLQLGSIQTSCVVRAVDGTTVFEAGQIYRVNLDIVFWDDYAHLFDPDEPVRLFEGSRLVAVGSFR